MAINDIVSKPSSKPFESSFNLTDIETKPQKEEKEKSTFQSCPEIDEPPLERKEWNDLY